MEASTKKRQRNEDDLEPSKKQSTSTTANQLQDIPTTEHYQVSYMHRSTVTHACTSLRHGYVVTGSVDGVVKFWKRVPVTNGANGGGGVGAVAPSAPGSDAAGGLAARCIEFVKSYSSHVGPLLNLSISQPTGDSAVSIGWDGVIKFYDVATFDVSGMIRTVAPEKAAKNQAGKKIGKKYFRLGRHAALVEKEDLYLLVSTRAPTREEWQWEQRERELTQQRNEEEEDGPRPVPVSNGGGISVQTNHDNVIDNMVAPGSILLFSGTNLSFDPLKVITYHASPVTALAYNATQQLVVSGDVNGVLEVWSPFSGTKEDSAVPYESKLDTDLYALIKKKSYAIDIAVSELGSFAVYSSDRKIRLFSFKNCKLVCIYDERLKVYDQMLHKSGGGAAFMGMDAIEYGKRAALEREMDDAYLLSGGVIHRPSSNKKQSNMAFSTLTSTSEGTHHQCLHLSFDNSGKFLLLPTVVGIKVINIQSHRVIVTVGKGDASAIRFLHVCLCPGDAKMDQQLQLARKGGSSAAISHSSGDDSEIPPNDSLLIAIAYGKRRFYSFSHHDPLDNTKGEPDEQTILARDILNEPPDASDLLEASHLGRGNDDPNSVNAPLTTATHAVLRTTHGDIRIKLFSKETPKTIQNFIGHAQSGYYDNVIFHRIIPGFMIQTGDPLGDGTGGESIWGGEFEDEIRRELRHDRPFTVSMANAGPNTNGSQFFITTVPTPWLDNKHTVFGRVIGGMEVVMAIEGVKTDDLDRPLDEVKILSVDVS